MKKKLGLFLSMLLIVPIIMTGCGRDGKKLLEDAMQNTADIKSQTLDFILLYEMDQDGFSTAPRLEFSFASDADSAHINFSMDSLLSAIIFQSFDPVSQDLYVQNGPGTTTIYAKDTQGNYIQTTVLANDDFGLETFMDTGFSMQSGGFAALANMSKSNKVVGTEEINGVGCDVVNITLDFEKISSFSSTMGKEWNDEQKILLNALAECIDFKFYIGKEDIRIHGIRLGVNDKLVSMINQLLKSQGASSMKLKDLQVEGGYTVDYQNELEAFPPDVQNAEELSNEEFEARCFLFQGIGQEAPRYDDYFMDDIYEDADSFWSDEPWDDYYDDDYMGS